MPLTVMGVMARFWTGEGEAAAEAAMAATRTWVFMASELCVGSEKNYS